VTVLQLVSCRGWSSDAYWAARVTVELERAGHDALLVCRRGTDARVMGPARALGVRRIDALGFASGLAPGSDGADLRRLQQWLVTADVVHVHRGKEHWLAAIANRLSHHPRPLVRTRHIVQPVRPHALNRWLYREATSSVVTVTEAIRRQCVAAGLIDDRRAVALPGGVDLERFRPWLEETGRDGTRPGLDDAGFRRDLGVPDGVPLVGLVSGFRVMKGQGIAIAAAAELRRRGRAFHLALIGRGAFEAHLRRAVAAAGLERQVSFVDFVEDLPRALAGLDLALYVPLESDGMSRALFEALAMGKAVIASRVGVVPEVLVDGESAVLVPGGDAPALADALGRRHPARARRSRRRPGPRARRRPDWR